MANSSPRAGQHRTRRPFVPISKRTRIVFILGRNYPHILGLLPHEQFPHPQIISPFPGVRCSPRTVRTTHRYSYRARPTSECHGCLILLNPGQSHGFGITSDASRDILPHSICRRPRRRMHSLSNFPSAYGAPTRSNFLGHQMRSLHKTMRLCANISSSERCFSLAQLKESLHGCSTITLLQPSIRLVVCSARSLALNLA